MTKRYDDMHFMMMPIDRQSDQSADVGLTWSFGDMIIWWCDVKIDWWHDNYSMMTKRYDYILFMMIQIDRQTDLPKLDNRDEHILGNLYFDNNFYHICSILSSK